MYNTSQNYKDKVLADSTQHELNIYIDGNKVDSNHIIDFKQTIELFNNNEFCLGCTPEIDIEFEIDKRDLPETYDEVYIETGVDDEIVPIGYFTIQKPIEDNEFKVKIKATDYMKKFEDSKYDGSDLTYPKTMLQVLQDICKKIGVELGSTSFLNSDKQIAVYDNTVSARTYLGYMAEQAGGIAVIGRDGKLYIRQIGQDVINFDINLFKDYKWGDKFKVSKVSYEDGIQDYKFGDETANTVYIDQNNMYIVDSEQIENIYKQIKDFEIYSFEGETIIDPAYDIGDILVIDGKQVLYQGELEYAGKFKANIKSKIQAKTEQESMQTKENTTTKMRRVQSEIDQANAKITQRVESVETQVTDITTTEITAEGNPIKIDDSAEEPILKLEVDGHSEQETSPSPEFPSEIKSVGDDGTLEIKQCGKNLLPNSATTATENGLTFTVNSDGSIHIVGTSTAGTLFNINRTKPITLNESSYVLSKFGDNEFVAVYLRKSSTSELIASMSGSQTVKNFNNNYTDPVFAYIAINANQTIDITIKLQLELGIETTEYEPYFSNSYILPLSEPIRSLPNGVCDTIEEDGVHRRVGSVVLDGSEDGWLQTKTNDNTTYYFFNKSIVDNSINSTTNFEKFLISNIGISESTYRKIQGTRVYSGNSVQIYIDSLNTLTVEQFKNWLSKNNVEIIYELEEETIEPFTDEQQEIIDNIRTNLYTQYFSSETNMRITYVRNNGLSDMYEIKNNAEKKYNETSKKIAELNIETDGIKTNVEEVVTSIGEVTDSLDKNINLLSADMQKKLEELGKSLTDYQLTVSTQFEQTNKDFNFLFNNIVEQINSSSENTSEKFAEIVKYIRFEDGNIILGRSDNELILKQSNDRISFIQNDNEVAYFSNNKLYVKEIEVTEKLFLANFAFVPESNGSLSFKKVRG